MAIKEKDHNKYIINWFYYKVKYEELKKNNNIL